MPRTSNRLPNSPKEWWLQGALGPILLFAACFYAGQGDEVGWPVAFGAWVSGLYVFFHAGVSYSRRLRDLGKDSRLPWLREGGAPASSNRPPVPNERDGTTSPNPAYRLWWAVALAGIVGTPLWVYESAGDHYVRVAVLVVAIAGALFTAGVLYERRLVELGKEAKFLRFRDNRHKV